MAEQADTQTLTNSAEQAHWSDEHEGIVADADLHDYAKKYTSMGEAIKGGYNAQKKLGSSFRIPDKLDTLTEEQRAELHSKVKALRNVPEKPEDYKIEKPKEIPPGMNYDQTLENSFRQFAHERGWDNKDVNDLSQWYNQSLIAGYNKTMQSNQKQMNEAINNLRIEWTGDYDKKLEGIKRLRQHISEELGLGYSNEKGELCSKLDDCLDMPAQNGIRFGNMPPVLQLLNWVFETLVAEGTPLPGGGGEPEKDFWKDFYAHPQSSKK